MGIIKPVSTPALATSRHSLGTLLVKLGPILALFLLVAVLSYFSENFRKPENFVKILNQSSFVGIVAIGMTWVIIVGGIDLSVGSMVVLLAGIGVMAMNRVYAGQVFDALSDDAQAAFLEAMMKPGGPKMIDVLTTAPPDVKDGVSMLPAIGVGSLIMVVGGVVLGLTNGLAIRVGKLAPFIATLGTMAIFRSIILASAEGGEIRSAVSAFGEIGSPRNGLTIPNTRFGISLPFLMSSKGKALIATWPIITFVVFAVVAELSLRTTTFGRKVLATGDNPVAARYAGINTGRVTMLVYTLCGALCGVAALLNASRMNSVSSSQTGASYELDAIAAVVIGGTAMRGGSGWVIGTVVGVMILGVIDNMLVMFGVNNMLQGLVKGCIIIAAVLIQRQRGTR